MSTNNHWTDMGTANCIECERWRACDEYNRCESCKYDRTCAMAECHECAHDESEGQYCSRHEAQFTLDEIVRMGHDAEAQREYELWADRFKADKTLLQPVAPAPAKVPDTVPTVFRDIFRLHGMGA